MNSSTCSKSKNTIGIDFGTTNSSIACAGSADGGADEVQLARFPYLGGMTDAYRSLLYLQQVQVKAGGAKTLKSWTGPIYNCGRFTGMTRTTWSAFQI